MLFQDESMIKEAAKTLGGEFHDLFAAMIADRPYDEIMDPEKKHHLKGRLKDKHSPEAKQERHKILLEKENGQSSVGPNVTSSGDTDGFCELLVGQS